MRIVITDKIDLESSHLKIINSLGEVTVYNDIPSTEEDIINRIKGAEIITANWINITKRIIDQSPSLKYIIVPAVGYEWVDVKAATKRKIKILNCPTHNSAAVANFTIALILGITRKIRPATISLSEGEWQSNSYKGIEIEGKKLGLIGHGNIGKRVEHMAKMLGMQVSYVDSKSSPKDVDELVSNSDIISLHLPLKDDTKQILDSRRLSLLKKGAYLVNVSRGGLIDQKALIKLLKSNYLMGAALDVFENEPMTGKPPTDIVNLAGMPNVLATPHTAFNTCEAFGRLGEELIENIKSCIRRKPINLVN